MTKNIDDILWKDAGCSTELDYAEQSSWILFLKWLDDYEKDKVIKSISPEKYKGICFDAQRHFNYNPTTKHRLILVATFI